MFNNDDYVANNVDVDVVVVVVVACGDSEIRSGTNSTCSPAGVASGIDTSSDIGGDGNFRNSSSGKGSGQGDESGVV